MGEKVANLNCCSVGMHICIVQRTVREKTRNLPVFEENAIKERKKERICMQTEEYNRETE